MALYFYFNETIGDLIYSDQATYAGSGYTSLGEQTNTNPTKKPDWIFSSQRENIKTVTKDPAISSPVDVLTSMKNMFMDCWSLTSLDISGFDTSNVTSMSYIFSACHDLTSIDLSTFDTSSVTEMDAMFNGCYALTSLDPSSLDTSNVTDMSSMFNNCRALTSIDLSGFDTSNVTDMSSMFIACNTMTSLDLSSFDTSNVTDMGSMFKNCQTLTSLNLSSFDTSAVTDMVSMFDGCQAIRIIDISSNMSNVLDLLPAATYYDAITRQSYAKADIPGGSTYVRDLADLDFVATMVQTRMGINRVVKGMLGEVRNLKRQVDAISTAFSKASGDADLTADDLAGLKVTSGGIVYNPS